MCPGHGFHGSDLDGISHLHPYYSRDYHSASHMKAKLAKDRCLFSEVRVDVVDCFASPGRVFQIYENYDWSPRMGQTNRV